MHSIDRARHGIRSELTSLPAPGERHGRSFTARIEGAHSDRAASASTGVADHILSGFFSAPSDWQVLGRSFDNIAGNLPHLLQGKGYDDIAPPWHSPIVARVTPQRFLPRDRVVGSQLRAWNEHRPTPNNRIGLVCALREHSGPTNLSATPIPAPHLSQPSALQTGCTAQAGPPGSTPST